VSTRGSKAGAATKTPPATTNAAKVGRAATTTRKVAKAAETVLAAPRSSSASEEAEVDDAVVVAASKSEGKKKVGKSGEARGIVVSMSKEATFEMAVLAALIVASTVVYFLLPVIYPVLGVHNATTI